MIMLKTQNPFIYLAVGLLLLFFGQQLFWLFVGAVGFLFGFELAGYYFTELPAWAMILIGIIMGLIGVVLALILQQAAIILGGIFAGGIIAVNLYGVLAAQTTDFFIWTFFITGGILGGLFMAFFFEWALVILSSLLGAMLIIEPFYEGSVINLITFIILFVLGVFFQGRYAARNKTIV